MERGEHRWEYSISSIFVHIYLFSFSSLFPQFKSKKKKSRTPSSSINCFALYISITQDERRGGWRTNASPSPSLPFCLQEAAASFAEWERLMKGLGSGVADNPFTEVMSLVTQMYKQTAIAKVMGHQVELCLPFPQGVSLYSKVQLWKMRQEIKYESFMCLQVNTTDYTWLSRFILNILSCVQPRMKHF